MEKESFFSGYCRVLDGSRTVCVVTVDGKLDEIDCCYPDCTHAGDCSIAQAVRESVSGQEA